MRVIRTCRRLGIRTVAVYSEADREAPHVQMADEAYLLGPPPVAASYLNIEKIIAVARQAKAEAIHPGYGLLSENPAFARACLEAGLIFIGPGVEAMAAVGDKLRARELMQAAGVPVVPGSHLLSGSEEALTAAEELGYPVIIKASGGGGGIGMQIVAGASEMERAFKKCSGRALANFGSGAVYLEKFLPAARHIEVQVLADARGRAVYLFERECSVQRRHQKVIEEAPSPAVDDDLRRRMGEMALKVVQAVGYVNAGTVECLYAGEDFYFLEMNARLQVEHPVTEMITGIDLVEAQIAVAAGQPLPWRQEDLRWQGHAVEARIYAEDPVNLLPATGKIVELVWPQGEHVRVDTGIIEGYQVTPYYDPLLAKIIARGENRLQAIERLEQALRETVIGGVKTNLTLLLAVLGDEDFRAGNLTTTYLESRLAAGLLKG